MKTCKGIRNGNRFLYQMIPCLLISTMLIGCRNQETVAVLAEQKTERQEGAETSKAEDESSIALLEAPKYYKTRVEGKRVILTAQADVIVPDVDTIPVYKVEKLPYSRSDFEYFKGLMADETGIQWGEETKTNGRISLYSQDRTYNLTFADGKDINIPPMRWLKNLAISAGSSRSFNARDISGLLLSEEEKNQIELYITEKAQTCLDMLQEGTYVLKSREWRALQEREDGGMKPNGEYGLWLKYVRLQNQIPVAGNLQALMGEDLPRIPYIEFLYMTDGTLLEVKDIDRESQEETGGEERFLLPFVAIAQIFEQYGKTYFDDGRHPIEESQADSVVLAEDKKVAFVNVDTVMLEYRYQPEEQGNQTRGGRLIPVWNFYGDLRIDSPSYEMPELRQTDRQSESLLVSIHAEDGTIYGN